MILLEKGPGNTGGQRGGDDWRNGAGGEGGVKGEVDLVQEHGCERHFGATGTAGKGENSC